MPIVWQGGIKKRKARSKNVVSNSSLPYPSSAYGIHFYVMIHYALMRLEDKVVL